MYIGWDNRTADSIQHTTEDKHDFDTFKAVIAAVLTFKFNIIKDLHCIDYTNHSKITVNFFNILRDLANSIKCLLRNFACCVKNFTNFTEDCTVYTYSTIYAFSKQKKNFI
jgi:hypothetical protein